MKEIQKPQSGEYPFYASMYMNLVPDDGKLLIHLKENFHTTMELIKSIPQEKLLYRYASDKWTIKEVLVHIIDDERIYAYRALRFARNDKTSLPGFDQNYFSHYADANNRSMESIMEEYAAVREATITLFNGFNDQALMRRGSADGKMATVRALGYHIAGHELHHIKIIKENYLS